MFRFHKELGFDDRLLLLFGIPFVALILSSVLYAGTLVDQTPAFFSICYPISIFYTTSFWFIFRAIIILVRKFDRFRSNTIHRILLEVISVMVAYVLLKPGLEYLLEILPLKGDFPKPHHTIEIFSSLVMSLFILLIYEIVYVQRQLEKSNLEKAQLSRAHMQAQLEGLRTQIQPHFLFNSLNTLSALIEQDAQRAEKYVQKLSRVFRYVLEIRDESLISLDEELRFLDAYIYLLKERFGSNLEVVIEVSEEYNQDLIAPLSLQILFENAIKHNTISKEKPLHILLTVSKDRKLIVENNLQLRSEAIKSTKIGLENIRKRYKFILDDPIEVIKTLETFRVSLPLVASVQVSN